MCDHKLEQNISVLDRDTHGAGTGRSSIKTLHEKHILESCGTDSGFLSGHNLSCDNIENDDDAEDHKIQPDTEKPSNLAITESIDHFTDTTAIDMILDSGVVDVGLNEWFCAMSIDGNNLNSSSRVPCSPPKVAEPKQITPKPEIPLWQKAYGQNDEGDTRLHLAIICENIPAIHAIIRLAKVPSFLDIQNDDGQTALHLAVHIHNPSIVRRLVISGAKLSFRDRNGNTALHLACLLNDADCVQALTQPICTVEFDAVWFYTKRVPQISQPSHDYELRNYEGDRPINIAAKNQCMIIIAQLYRLGADINAPGGQCGLTPLQSIVLHDNEELLVFLLQECKGKLNLESLSYARLTAYQLAKINRRQTMMDRLVEGGAIIPEDSDSEDDSDLECGCDRTDSDDSDDDD